MLDGEDYSIFGGFVESYILEQGVSWAKCFRWLSLPTTTIFIQVLGWHHLKLCMGGGVGLCCVGMSQERVLC